MKIIFKAEMKKILILIFIPLTSFVNSKAAIGDFLLIGLKIGSTFYEDGGFYLGLEFSAFKTYKHNEILYGLSLNADAYKEVKRVNLNFKVQKQFIPGVGAGPSVIFKKDSVRLGMNFNLNYNIVVVNPYLGFSYFPKYRTFSEIGAFIRWPVFGGQQLTDIAG